MGCVPDGCTPASPAPRPHSCRPARPRSELLLFLLPLLNVQALKHALRSYLPRLPILSAGLAGGGGGAVGGGGAGDRQPCGICNAAEVLQPYVAVPCGHAFCYYCLRSHCLADPTYSCPLCLRRVDAMQPCLPAAAAAADGDEPAADGSGGGEAARGSGGSGSGSKGSG